MTSIAQLDILKEKLVQADDFLPVLDYFITHFGEDRKFMKMGKPSREPVLEAAIVSTIEHMVGKKVSPKSLQLVRLKEGFVHGSSMFESNVLTVMYFEELKMGMLAITTPFGSDEVQMARFTCTLPANN